VLKCLDHKTKEEVAIKVLKKTHTSKKQGLTEYKIIQLLQSNAPNNNCIVEVRRKFEFRFHFFIVFELLGVDLHHFLHVHEYRPISVNLVKRIAAQLLTGLAQMHSLNIIHCDLKPENIAFKNSNKSSIRILDFGSSCFADMMIFTYIQTRLYRSPEVILQCGDYDSAIDIWSLGCIVAELLLGEPVFKGKNEARMIKSIVRVLGFPPENVVNRAKAKSLLKNCYERGVVSLRSVFTKYSQDVVDFIEGCLKWEPDKRITAQEGLNAKWFRPMHSRVKSMIY
jgi:dual specificity tyrosine-phosphorylation-regulated kinase 2/3/4